MDEKVFTVRVRSAGVPIKLIVRAKSSLEAFKIGLSYGIVGDIYISVRPVR